MRIAYCIHSLHRSGGIERVLTLKANALTGRGHEVWILTASMRGRKPFFPLDEAVRTLDLDVNEKLFFNGPTFRRKLNAALQQIRPDITLSVCGRELYSLPACTDGSIKLAEYHFSHRKYELKYGRNALGRAYAGWRTRRFARAAARMDGFIVLTREDQAWWQDRLPRVHQIYNPLTFKPEETALLEERRCIAVGRLEPQKNFKDLVHAWKTVAREAPDWTLAIFGEGSLRQELQRQIASEGLEPSVQLMGHSKQIGRELLRSSCAVMSSVFEGFPMILLEAAACGLPMVSYDCSSGPAEIIRDGSNGYLVPVGDTDGLAQRILQVIRDPQGRKKLGEEARLTAGSFTMDRIMEQWETLFRSYLSKRDGSGK